MHVFGFGVGGRGIRGRSKTQLLGRNVEFLSNSAQDADVLRAASALQAAHLGLVVAQHGGDVLLRAPL